MDRPDLTVTRPTAGTAASARALNAALTGEPQAVPTSAPATGTPDTRLAAPVSLLDLAEPEGSPLIPKSLGLRPRGTAAPEKGSLWDAAWQAEGTFAAVRDIFAVHGFEATEGPAIPELDSPEWKETVGDLPTEYWADFADAVSPEHFKALAAVARKDYEAEQVIASHGGAGVAGRIGAAMLDPVALAIGLGTGSLGWAAKGTRLMKAGKLAGIAAAENAAIEAVLAEASPGRDAHDVAYAALAGFTLGGTFGYLLSKGEAVRATELGTAEAARLGKAELDAFIGPSRPAARAETVDDIEQAIDGLLPASRLDDTAAAGDAPAMTVAQIARQKLLAERKVVEIQKAVDDVDVDAIEARMAAEDAASGNPSTPKMRRKAAEVEAKGARQEAHKRLSDAKQGLKKVEADEARLLKATEARRRLKRNPEGKSVDEKLALIDDPELRALYQGRLLTARAAAEMTGRQITMEEVVSRSAGADKPDVVDAADSGGAARVEGSRVDTALRDIPDPGVTVAETKFRSIRFDLAATLRGAHQGARNMVGRYVGDSVGAVDGQVTEIGASEIAARHHERLLAKFYSGLTPAYNAWAKEAGKGSFGKWKRTTRRDFNTLVSRAIRDQSGTLTDPHAIKAAGEIRAVFAEVLKEAKGAGVKGFEKVAENPHYVPRVFNFQALFKLGDEFGPEALTQLVRGAMRSNTPDTVIDDDILDWLAKGYVQRLREVGMGLDSRTAYGVAAGDHDAVAGLMRAAGASDDQVNDVISRLKAITATTDTGEGSVRYGKMRFDLDEQFATTMTGKAGTRQVAISDLFENDIEHLMGRYIRSMSGHIGMAKIGVRSFDDHKKNLEGLASLYEGDTKGLEKIRDAADLAYKLVTGQPVEKLGDVARWSRFLRDYNFTRTMNQAGFAQIPDLAGLFSSAYLRHTLTHLPELGRMMKRGTDGKVKDDFARELEEWLGVGTDYHNVAVFSMFDVEAEGFAGALGKAEHGLRVMGRGTQAMSGMAFITAAAQRMSAKGIAQRFVSGKFSPERLSALGIDDAMHTRIKAQIDAHTQLVAADSGRKVKAMNWGAWTDVDARDALLQGIHKEARRLVQEEDVGDTAGWMHSSLGKLVIQFRRFGIVAYTKQLLNGASHADAETATRAMMSFALAGAAYWAQQQVRMSGMSDRDRKVWEKKYLSGDRLAAAAFARSSFSSLTPAVSDSVTSMLFGTKAFDVRVSGQASDLIGGISSVDAANKFARVLSKGSQAVLRDDRQFTDGDLKAAFQLLPYGNLPPMQFGFESLVRPGLGLPTKQRDTNPDDVNWSFD